MRHKAWLTMASLAETVVANVQVGGHVAQLELAMPRGRFRCFRGAASPKRWVVCW